MLKNYKAISLLLRDEMPRESEATRAAVARAKFRCVAAMQVYSSFDSAQLADVERLVQRYEGALCVAYLEDVEVRPPRPRPRPSRPAEVVLGVVVGSPPLPPAQRTYYSCLIDGTQTDDDGKLRKDAGGRLAPTYRIELPGMPILGNGKSDNQNCALPFTRGPILQAIDCNQDGYLEEARRACVRWLPVLWPTYYGSTYCDSTCTMTLPTTARHSSYRAHCASSRRRAAPAPPTRRSRPRSSASASTSSPVSACSATSLPRLSCALVRSCRSAPTMAMPILRLHFMPTVCDCTHYHCSFSGRCPTRSTVGTTTATPTCLTS